MPPELILGTVRLSAPWAWKHELQENNVHTIALVLLSLSGLNYIVSGYQVLHWIVLSGECPTDAL